MSPADFEDGPWHGPYLTEASATRAAGGDGWVGKIATTADPASVVMSALNVSDLVSTMEERLADEHSAPDPEVEVSEDAVAELEHFVGLVVRRWVASHGVKTPYFTVDSASVRRVGR